MSLNDPRRTCRSLKGRYVPTRFAIVVPVELGSLLTERAAQARWRPHALRRLELVAAANPEHLNVLPAPIDRHG